MKEKLILFCRISSKYIQETLDGVVSSEPAFGDCLLVHMLRDQNMTYEQVVGMATSLLFAGIDTVNIFYTFALTCDKKHCIYDKIRYR